MNNNAQRKISSTILRIALLALVAVGFGWAFAYHRQTTDPLITGIPPHDNGDGTVDYTLIGPGFWDEQLHRFQVAEWVVRLSAKNVVHQGTGKDVEVLDGGSWKTVLRSNSNDFLSAQFMIADMAPVASDEARLRTLIPKTEGAFQLSLDGIRTGDNGKSAAVSLKDIFDGKVNQECIATGRIIFGMQEFRPGSELGSCSSSDLAYVLWADESKKRVTAEFQCKTKGIEPTCRARWYLDYRYVYGNISYRQLEEFKTLTKRVQDFVARATIVDHVYAGNPFVTGGKGK
jgi:hypothetical protein